MPQTPKTSVTLYRMQLEHALLCPDRSPQELLRLSQSLDTLINHALRVRSQPIRRRALHAVRRKRRFSRALL